MQFGISYRATAAYVADPVGVTYCLEEDTYPTTRGGITFGRLSPTDSARPSRDRSLIPDVRLAGMFQRSNATDIPGLQRIDLPEGPGTYSIRLAGGDYQYSKAYNFLQILDGQEGEILHTVLGNCGVREFVDAQSNVWSHTEWAENNQPVVLTFSSNHCVVQVGDGPLPSRTGDAALCHLQFTYIPSSTALVKALVLKNAEPQQISAADLGSDVQPLIYLSGDIKQRVASEGKALVLAGGSVREIQPGEVLQI